MSTDLLRAQALLDIRRSEQALTLLGNYLANNPGHGRALGLVAQAELQRGRYPAARQAAVEAAQADPESEWPRRLWSIAAQALGDHDEALQQAREAVRLEPDFAVTWTNLAMTLSAGPKAERWWRNPAWTAEAREAAATALRLDPDSGEAHRGQAAVAGRLADREGARRAWQQVLQLQPGDPEAISQLARIDELDGKVGQAATKYAQAVGAEPDRRREAGRILDLVWGIARRWFAIMAVASFCTSSVWLPTETSRPSDPLAISIAAVSLAAFGVIGLAVAVRRTSRPVQQAFRREAGRAPGTYTMGLSVMGLLALLTVPAYGQQPHRCAAAATAMGLFAIAWFLSLFQSRWRVRRALP